MKSKWEILGVGARIAGVWLRRSRAPGVGHLKNGKQIATWALAIIKPKIARHTIILSTNNLFLPTTPTSPTVDRKEHYPDTYLDAYGVEQIIQGALRLAAHGVLRERPHFGGKYSTELIKRGVDGIKPDVEVVRVMTRAEEKKYRQERSERDALLKTLRESPPTPRERQKPWSSRDTISYRDLPKKRP
jgi:hypothetical protein